MPKVSNPNKANLDTDTWTYGVEHEWADWCHDSLPSDFKPNRDDNTVVNSNGIANDPSGTLYRYGGEINTPPTKTAFEQVKIMQELKKTLEPRPTINYRSNLHIHIRVPGLANDLESLKRIQSDIHNNLFQYIEQIDPLPTVDPTQDPVVFKGAKKRRQRYHVSHHTRLPHDRYMYQMRAKTVEDFFKREAPLTNDGRPMFHIQPRLCVNLRQLKQTDTVEFRHFAGTLKPFLLLNSLYWCKAFLFEALLGRKTLNLFDKWKKVEFPVVQPYRHDLETIYQLTCHNGKNKKEDIKRVIDQVLSGTFKPTT